MFTLLDFQKFSLNEKLELRLAKYYTRLWKDAKGDKRYRKMFGGKNRIYIPLEGQSTIDHFSDIIDDIERALEDLGYKPLSIEGNWAKQIKGRKEKKITKVLSSDKEKRYEDLNNQYLKILDLHKKAEEDLYEIVISRHGYDIAGMSTDRGWTSCMNVIDGGAQQYIEVDIEKGSIIAYLIKKKDRNIQNARARLLIKPFVSSDGEEMVLFADETVYGTDLDGFRETVEKWLRENQKMTKFKYNLLKDLYDDGLREVCNLNFLKIEDLLNSEDIIKGKWKINDDNTINVNGSVYLKNIVKGNKDSIKEILFNEYSFGIIDEDFNCLKNKLKNLEGGPRKVYGYYLCFKNQLVTLKGGPEEVGKDFNCDKNNLTTLKGSPQKVGYNFSCGNNKLVTLEGAPKEVGGYFWCSDNQLVTLEGAPQRVGSGFNCHNNKLTSLNGAPSYINSNFTCQKNKLTTLKRGPQNVDGFFMCQQNQLVTLEGAPQKVGGNFSCYYNNLTSLKGAPQKIYGSFNCSYNLLETLEGGPQEVDDEFNCFNNPLNTLKGFPKIIGSDLIIDEDFPFTDEEIREVCKIKGRIIRL